MTRHASLLALVVSGLIGCAAPASAQALADAGSFTITVRGIKAGVFRYEASRSSGDYAVSSLSASSGVVGLLRKFTTQSRVTGIVKGTALRPLRYLAQSKGGRHGRSAELAYDSATPSVISTFGTLDPDAPPIDPKALRGTVDPLTALYAILRDTPATQACALDLKLFDGHRLSHVKLKPTKAQADTPMCDGTFRRIAGYPANEVAKGRSFPFSVRFTALDATTLRVTELTMDSPFGPARMTRD